ncbi:MAG: glutamine synthetase family protein [Pseudomonadota bacterium]
MTADIEDQIRQGNRASQGHYTEQAIAAAAEVIRQVEADELETIRVVFPDQHGILRGKTITQRALASAFTSGIGMPSTLLLKDTAHKTVFPVWDGNVSIGDMPLAGAFDVICAPDPMTFRRVPWSPHSAFLISDLIHRTGDRIGFSSRNVLRQAEEQLDASGFQAVFGLEVEFQLFERVDPALGHAQATMPPTPVETRNITQGWQYLTETRYGEAEAILDELRRISEELGLAPRTVEIEMGPSQFEFTFEPSGPMDQADRFALFRTMVKEVSHAHGLHASFMAKPKLPNAAANGWHIHQSLIRKSDNQNAFMPDEDGALTETANRWIAGLLENAAASCLMTTPTVNGYKRFAPHQLAPNRIQWGTDNRGAMVRALLYPGDAASRVENRVADTAANPYFALAAQILSGLDGINRDLQAPVATDTPYHKDAPALPASLIVAIEAFENSHLYSEKLSPDFVAYLSRIKRAEWDRYLMTVSEWEQTEYFNLF